jgi:glycogen phosphorylase
MTSMNEVCCRYSISLCRILQPAGAVRAYAYRAPVPAALPAKDYTARMIPHCAGVAVPLEVDPILWQR